MNTTQTVLFSANIVITEEGELPVLVTRKQFETENDAREYIKGYSVYWQERSIVVECPHGLTY